MKNEGKTKKIDKDKWYTCRELVAFRHFKHNTIIKLAHGTLESKLEYLPNKLTIYKIKGESYIRYINHLIDKKTATIARYKALISKAEAEIEIYKNSL